MKSFEFTKREQIILGSGVLLGIISILLTLMVDENANARLWSNLLHNSVFFIGIAFMALFFTAVNITAWSGWYITFKRVWESFYMGLIYLGIPLIIILGLANYLSWHELYHWNDPESVAHDELLKGKSAFLNNGWYGLGCFIIVLIWVFFALKLRKFSILEDNCNDGDFELHHKIRIYAAAFLPIAGFSICAFIWQLVMSIDAHWYSTLFAWYSGASVFVAMIALTIMVLYYFKSKELYQSVTENHLHDLGKFLFAFSIFWTYLWFSQYMLIWYANIGEETVYFYERINNYPTLFYGNLIINFIIPFFVLIRNDTKRKAGTMIAVSFLTFIGHWVDYFLMIKPGVLHTSHELAGGHGGNNHAVLEHSSNHVATFVNGFSLPGFLELGTMIGFLSIFLYIVFFNMGKANLIGKNDPYLGESLHHHV